MPEGPTLVIAKEDLTPFIGKTIVTATGNAKIDFERLIGRRIKDIRTWGKLLLITVKDANVRIHFLMFGAYSINAEKRQKRSLRLHLSLKKDDIYFYTCAVRLLEDEIVDEFDWEADVLSDDWNPAKARKKLKKVPDTLVCDALLDQTIFAGVGNIIKNEVLYRINVHPQTRVGDLPPRKLTALITEARNYSFDFLAWKKIYQLKKHWLIYTKKKCKRCDLPAMKEYLGKTKRRTFFCDNCQVNYSLKRPRA
jgi:endonuclease-8